MRSSSRSTLPARPMRWRSCPPQLCWLSCTHASGGSTPAPPPPTPLRPPSPRWWLSLGTSTISSSTSAQQCPSTKHPVHHHVRPPVCVRRPLPLPLPLHLPPPFAPCLRIHRLSPATALLHNLPPPLPLPILRRMTGALDLVPSASRRRVMLTSPSQPTPTPHPLCLCLRLRLLLGVVACLLCLCSMGVLQMPRQGPLKRTVLTPTAHWSGWLVCRCADTTCLCALPSLPLLPSLSSRRPQAMAMVHSCRDRLRVALRLMRCSEEECRFRGLPHWVACHRPHARRCFRGESITDE